MPDRRPVLRLFVAAYPPADSARSMLDLLRDRDLPAHRPVPPEQLHLTLQFIGDTDPRQLDDVKESVRRAAAGLPAFDLAPRELITLPDRGDPRLLALTTDTPPTLLEIQRRLAARLAKNPRDRQRFLPHLTLCRFDPHAPIPARIHQPAALPAFRIEAIFLMNSKLKPGGAQHVEVEHVPLDAR